MIAPRGSRILIADDDQSVQQSLSNLLGAEGFRVTSARSGTEALRIIDREPIELVIADLQMPGIDGLELTRRAQNDWPNLPVLILTGNASVETAVQALQLGAADYLRKPTDPSELLVKVAKSLQQSALRTQNQLLAAQVEREGRYGEIIAANPKMTKIFQIIDRVAEAPSRVLIQGEPGTGKELIARAIHQRSLQRTEDPNGTRSRRFEDVDHPYIAVNCGAFSRTLLESQLFGHKKGTFTGAITDQEGVFVAARYGTLFLDEITCLELDLQVKLLRAIQEREVTPLGSTQPVPIHARIITATNQPIAELVRDGAFRSDLYFRINVVHVQVPPLRERIDDLPLLVEYFLKQTAESYGVMPRQLADKVMEAFQSYHWPGNVRELQNVIERAFALGENEKRITLEDLPPDLLRKTDASGEDGGSRGSVFPSLDQILREHIVKALQASRGVKTKAARLLRIDRNRLYRLMDKYEVARRGE